MVEEQERVGRRARIYSRIESTPTTRIRLLTLTLLASDLAGDDDAAFDVRGI